MNHLLAEPSRSPRREACPLWDRDDPARPSPSRKTVQRLCDLVAIATATMLFGLSSGAALATVVGVLIEVPVMLMLVKICLKTQRWFPARA